MSASDTIHSIVNLAKSEATGTVESAKALVAQAVDALVRYSPVYPRADVTVSESGVSVGGGFSAEEKPPGFPGIREPKLPPDPALQDLDMIDATFDAAPPTLDLPDFDYALPAPVADFTERAPTIDPRVALPARPQLDWPDRPTLLPVAAGIAVDPMVVPTLDVETPTYANSFSEDWWRDFSEGQNRAPGLRALAPELLAAYHPGALDNYRALGARVGDILEGRATALTDAFDQHLYDALRGRVEAERQAGLRRVSDAADGAGWGLPGRVVAAMRERVVDDTERRLSDAALEVYTKRAERELQHLQFVMELASKLHGAAMQFVVQATEAELAAFRAALAFADSASAFALRVYELRQKDFEIEVRLSESAIEVFKARLSAEEAKGNLTRIKLELEKLKSELNRDQIALYSADLQSNETRVRVYTAEIGALEAELRARKFPLDLFESKLRAHIASVDAKKAEYALVEARLGGDKARVEGELAKVRLYEADASVFKTVVDAQAARLTGQAKRNDQELAEFSAKLDAQLKLAQIDESMAKHALTTYETMARVFVEESQQRLREAQFAHEKALAQAKLDRDATEFDYNRQFNNLKLEMTRVQAIANMMLSTAKVNGDMASSALSALNSIVSVAQTEQV